MSCILNYPNDYPVATEANGALIWIDGKECIDTSLGSGTHILGHNADIYLERGTLFGAKASNVDRFGKLLQKMTGFEKFVLCNSGSEATMRAMRIARAYTGRTQIGLFEGCWHGTHDGVLECAGIPKEVKSTVVRMPFDMSAVDIIKKNKFAMVFIEPLPGSLPRLDKKFLEAIRDVTTDTGALLGFDEVISGFRMAPGGIKELTGIDCEIATYGKIAGGGFPMGIVAGKSHIMDVVTKKDVTMGGTFSCNPISVGAGYTVLSQLTEGVYDHINVLGMRFRSEIKLPTCGLGSFSRILFTNKPVKNRKERDLYEQQHFKYRFYRKALEAGIFIGKNGLQFFSTAHTHDIVTQIVDTLNSI